MTYSAPVNDILFTLRHVADFADNPLDVDQDLIQALLGGAAQVAEHVLHPLDRLGDRFGVDFQNGCVRTPAGFRNALEAMGQGGWLGLSLPVDHGGSGLSPILDLACQELWASANLALSLCPTMAAGAARTILSFGTPAQKKLYVPRIARGEWSATMLLTESQAGSDLGRIATRAVLQPDGSYRLFGTKIFISWGEHDLTSNIVHLVLARIDGAPSGSAGLTLFIVPKILCDENGMLQARNDIVAAGIEEKLGLHASPTCTMRLGEGDGAIGYQLGEIGQGLTNMFVMMNHSRLVTGMEGVAIGERAYQEALRYALERQQGRIPQSVDPVPIIHHPDVRQMLLKIRARTDAARALCLFAAARSERGSHSEMEHRNAGLLIPVAKAWSTAQGEAAASLVMQIFGGMGYIEETGVAQLLRDVRITSIYEGTNGIQAIDLVGRRVIGDDGRELRLLIAMISETLSAAGAVDDPLFGAIVRSLSVAVQTLEFATLIVLDEGLTQRTLLGASRYLEILGVTLGGWLLAKLALAAKDELDAGSGDVVTLRNRIVLANFFAVTDLSLVPGFVEELKFGQTAFDYSFI